MTTITDPGDSADTPSPEATAFQTEQRTWKGTPLAPFAIDREGAWMLHRHMVGAPPLPDIIENVGAMALDAIRVLWFCAHEPNEWLAAPDGERAADLTWHKFTPTERAQRLEQRISEWSREHITGAEIPEAVSTFYELFSAAHSTRTTTASDGRAHSLGN